MGSDICMHCMKGIEKQGGTWVHSDSGSSTCEDGIHTATPSQ